VVLVRGRVVGWPIANYKGYAAKCEWEDAGDGKHTQQEPIVADGTFQFEVPDAVQSARRLRIYLENPSGQVAGYSYLSPTELLEIVTLRCEPKLTRSGGSHRSQCPICQRKFWFPKRYIKHVRSHDTKGDTLTTIQAIFLGIASSAIWDLTKWLMQVMPLEEFNRVVGDLFYLNVPMGGGGSARANSVLDSAMTGTEESRKSMMSSIDYGVYKLTEQDAKVLQTSIDKWIDR
jgi:hypothetical protein